MTSAAPVDFESSNVKDPRGSLAFANSYGAKCKGRRLRLRRRNLRDLGEVGRNLVEQFFNKIKHCRRVATRYDKLAANYLAFVQLASTPMAAR